jgi:uncharacterized protein YdeI (YjbR/CyaY-like superfamily)
MNKLTPVFFSDQNEFRKWLEKNHRTEAELLVGYYKIASGRPSMTWSQSVDQAICFGWIDGIRRSIDTERYCIRFTPRKPTSIWSKINIGKVEVLTKQGLMYQSGLDAFDKRKMSKSGIYSFENEPAEFAGSFEEMFKLNRKAWDFFNLQAPSYRKTIIRWIMSARQEKTKMIRLVKTITESENHNRIRFI